jgi:hypothetical protein
MALLLGIINSGVYLGTALALSEESFVRYRYASRPLINSVKFNKSTAISSPYPSIGINT